MYFTSKPFRLFSQTPDLLDGQILLNGYRARPLRQDMVPAGTLSTAELRRIVADMVG